MTVTKNIIHAIVARGTYDDGRAIHDLSVEEQLIVALVLDRKDWLDIEFGKGRADAYRGRFTMLEAVERLGPEWTRAALEVQREWGPEAIDAMKPVTS